MTTEEIAKVVNRMERPVDQQPMRDAIALIEHHGISVQEFVALSDIEMISRIEDFRSEMKSRVKAGAAPSKCRITAYMDNPFGLVRRMRRSFYRLQQQFKDCGYPIVPEPAERCLRPYRNWDEQNPAKIKAEINQWNPPLKVKKTTSNEHEGRCATTNSNGASTKEGALSIKSIIEYRTTALQVVTLSQRAGLDIVQNFDMEFMTEPETISLWHPLLLEHFEHQKTLAPFLTGVKRVARDILGSSHPNVAALAAIQRTSSRTGGLSANETEGLRDMTRSETKCATIWDVPAGIDERANAPGLTPAHRNSRKSCAVAAEILLCTVAFAPGYLARLNLDEHVRNVGNGCEVLVISRDGSEQWCPLPQKASHRIEDLKGFRFEQDLESPWLFPAKCGTKPQTPMNVTTTLASNIIAVLGRRLRPVDMRDALIINAVDRGIDDSKLIADAAGVSSRTIEQRFRIALQNPTLPAE